MYLARCSLSCICASRAAVMPRYTMRPVVATIRNAAAHPSGVVGRRSLLLPLRVVVPLRVAVTAALLAASRVQGSL